MPPQSEAAHHAGLQVVTVQPAVPRPAVAHAGLLIELHIPQLPIKLWRLTFAPDLKLAYFILENCSAKLFRHSD